MFPADPVPALRHRSGAPPMKPPFMLSLTLITLLMIGTMVAIAAGPSFESERVKLSFTSFESTVDLAFGARRDQAEYTVAGEVKLSVPNFVDAVAVNEQLIVQSVVDGERRPILAKAPKPTTEFNAFWEDNGTVALSEIPETELRANPYTVDRMVVMGQVLIAEQRKQIVLPKDVTPGLIEAPGNMRVRLKMLEFKRNGEAELEIDYARIAGIKAPFIEKAFVLDKHGNELAGGRWNVSAVDLADEDGVFKVEFKVNPNSDISGIKLVIVTAHRVQETKFEVREVFQR
jgi:hypothetical protein